MQFDVKAYQILLVDDDEMALELYTEYLSNIYNVITASSVTRALQILKHKEINLVITDLVMPGRDGLELISEIKKNWQAVSIMVISGQATVRTAVAAMKAGAEELILKPVTDLDFVALQIKRSLYKTWLQSENQRLNSLLCSTQGAGRIQGSSKSIQVILHKISKIAQLNTTILLTGETGVGKSFFARVIHEESNRKNEKFVSINCGALTETLLESSLFGHKRGAFTGAVKDRKGLFEEADGGTLFLDEVSETTAAFQVKLLNAIERGIIRKVGGEEEIKIDVRLIFATNRNLKKEVEAGRFRKDLYFRINVVNLRVPALRERKEDILIMANAFLKEFCAKHHLGNLQFAVRTKEILRNMKWEGNIRELRNCIEHSAIMSDSQEIKEEHLPDYMQTKESLTYIGQISDLDYRGAKESFERSYFEILLRKNQGNVTEAARESGLARQCVYRKLTILGIKPDEYRS